MPSDGNIYNLSVVIAASLAAIAASVSAVMSWLTFGKMRQQTDILLRQFEVAESARQDSVQPRPTVEISQYRPPEAGQSRGQATFTLRNAGHFGLRLITVRTISGNSQNEDVNCSIEIHPGYPANVRADVQPMDRSNPPAFRAWFQFETSDGKQCRLEAHWELRNGQFVPLKSETVLGRPLT